mgnify:CR=1 FL=1
MSNPWDIVILGCGHLGGNLKTELEAEKLQVLGVRRTPMPDDPTCLRLDLDAPDSWDRLCRIPLSQQAVIVTIMTPDTRTEVAYRERARRQRRRDENHELLRKAIERIKQRESN